MILVIGLSPALQKTYYYDFFKTGEVNRAKCVITNTGGKAVGVTRILNQLGTNHNLIQILSGKTGEYIENILLSDGINTTNIWSESSTPTRVCTTIIIKGSTVTELVEECGEISKNDLNNIYKTIEKSFNNVKIICMSGSNPKGVPDDFYAKICKIANSKNIPVIIDTQRDALNKTIIEHPFIIKPNLEEASNTLNLNLSGNIEKDAKTSIELFSKKGAQWILISCGKYGAFLGNDNEFYRITPPDINVVNPIGAGDSMTAGILHYLINNDFDIYKSVVFGTACALSSCLINTPGIIDLDTVNRFLAKIKIENLPV